MDHPMMVDGVDREERTTPATRSDRFLVHGLSVDSPVPLPFARERRQGGGAADVILRTGEPHASAPGCAGRPPVVGWHRRSEESDSLQRDGVVLRRHPRRAVLEDRLSGDAVEVDCTLNPARLTVRTERALSGAELAGRIVGDPLAFVLHMMGRLPLHAAAAARGTAAVVFVGPSGSGKSTIAHVAQRIGDRALADDITVLVAPDGADGWSIRSSRPTIRLEEATLRTLARSLGGSDPSETDRGERGASGGGASDPRRWMAPAGRTDPGADTHPVRAIVYLGPRAPRLTLSPLDAPAAQRWSRLHAQVFGATMLRGEERDRLAGMLTSLVQDVPQWEARMPDDLAALPAALDQTLERVTADQQGGDP